MDTFHFYVAFFGQTAPQLDREWHLAQASWPLCHGSCTPVRGVIAWSDGRAGGAGQSQLQLIGNTSWKLLPFSPLSTWLRFGWWAGDLTPPELRLFKVPLPAAVASCAYLFQSWRQISASSCPELAGKPRSPGSLHLFKSILFFL